jgi:hypothetical protein
MAADDRLLGIALAAVGSFRVATRTSRPMIRSTMRSVTICARRCSLRG